MAKIISIANHKGGVGKTTTTANLGAYLALEGLRTLLIDCDPQANLTQNFNVQSERSLYDCLTDSSKIVPTVRIKPYLSIVPSSLDLAAAEFQLMSTIGKEYLLKNLIANIEDQYDYILIDCPPSLGLMTINALTASHHVLIPLQAEYFPLVGLNNLKDIINKIKTFLNAELSIGGIVFTRYSKRILLNKDIADRVQHYFPESLLKQTISNSISLSEAQREGMDIFEYNANTKGFRDYRDLCIELFDRGVF